MIKTINKRLTLSIIVLNYKTPELTSNAVLRLIPEIDRDDHGIVIVDNLSNDGSCECFAKLALDNKDYNIKVVANEENGGFSYGMNSGIKAVEAEFYILLNSDAYPRKNAIKNLLEGAKTSPSSIIYPRLEWDDGTAQRNYFKDHSYLSQIIDAASFSPITALLKNWDVPSADPEFSNVEWVSFACVLIPNTVLDRYGLLDEDFFLYYEDSEYCRRVRLKGVSFVHIANSKFVHFRGKSSPVKSNMSTRARLPTYYYQSRSRYFKKRNKNFGLLLANTSWYLGRCVSIVREILGKKRPHLPQFAHKDIWHK